MRSSRLLFFYVARGIAAYSALALLAITIVLVSQNLLRRFSELVLLGFTLADFLRLAGWLVPMLLAYALPTAFVVGALLAFHRLASDSEIIAMRSCGLGIGALLAPTLCLAVAASAASAWVVLGIEHDARLNMLTSVKLVGARGAFLESGEFRTAAGRIFFADHRDRNNHLRGIMLFDRTNPERPFVVFAEEGQLSFDEERFAIRVHLDRGDVHFPGDQRTDRFRSVDFEAIEFGIALGQAHIYLPTRPKQMSMPQLRDVLATAEAGEPLHGILALKNPIAYELEIHRRFFVPIAPMLFAPIVVALGVLGTRGRRSLNILIGLGIVFGYYALFSLAGWLAVEGMLPAWLVYWIPSLALLGVGAAMLERARSGVSA